MRKSKWFQFILTWVLIICVTAVAIEFINIFAKDTNGNDSPPSSQKPPEDNKTLHWGIDTASHINQSALQCVNKNYGKPEFVGRYLGSNGDASSGLTKDEVKYLHDQKIKIMPIHNQFNQATGKANGQAEAEEAIKLAKDVGVKEGVVLIADIEPTYKVDADFIIGWTQTVLDNKYIPGVYGNLDSDELKNAFVQASDKDNNVKEKLILWTNQPIEGTTRRDKAPKEFKGKSPDGDSTLVWQYGIEGKNCNVDTDLAKENLLDILW